MKQESVKFWIKGDDGDVYGPANLAEIQAWIAEGRVGPDSEAALDMGGKAAPYWKRLDLYTQTIELWERLHEDKAKSAGSVPAEVRALAPMWRRVLAGFFDLAFIFTLFGIGFALVLSYGLGLNTDQIQQLSEIIMESASAGNLSGSVGDLIWIVNVIGYVVMAIYFGYFHVRYDGRTLGMSICGLKVLSEDSRRMNVAQAALRTLGLVVTVSFYGLGFIFVFFTRRRQALHDLISRTLVVENRVEN
jgi:uncharacterized RDD family membrane protein YckC